VQLRKGLLTNTLPRTRDTVSQMAVLQMYVLAGHRRAPTPLASIVSSSCASPVRRREQRHAAPTPGLSRACQRNPVRPLRHTVQEIAGPYGFFSVSGCVWCTRDKEFAMHRSLPVRKVLILT